MKNLAVIIPIFNRLEVTKKGLVDLENAISFYKSKPPQEHKLAIHIVVVDDGSTDGSGEFIKANYPQIHLVKGTGDLWWSGGINEGIKAIREKNDIDYVLLWNNDIIPIKEYFVNLDKLSTSSGADILGSYIYEDASGKLWSDGGRFNRISGRRSMKRNRIKDSKYAFEWLPGMGTFVPVSVIDDIGYWDEKEFPQYHGDFDFTIRASLAGYKIKTFEALKIFNRTEFSSYSASSGIKSFFKSFKSTNLRSRYNLKKDVKIYLRYCIGPFWLVQLCKKYLIYTLQVIRK